jgi:hypothetical protein
VARPHDDNHPDAAADGRRETEAERADRNFNELLQELRVAQTGVQILFAFLLTLPFTQRFASLNAEQEAVYLGTLVATALATACLIAPVSQHRILFRQRRKVEIVHLADRMSQAGLVFLFVAVIGSVYLIFDVVKGRTLAVAVSGVLAVFFAWTWYAQPMLKRRQSR